MSKKQTDSNQTRRKNSWPSDDEVMTAMTPRLYQNPSNRQNYEYFLEDYRNPNIMRPTQTDDYYYRQLKEYIPLRKWGEILVTGYIGFECGAPLKVAYITYKDIVVVCKSYLYDINDETYQLAHILYTTMNKIRKKSMTKDLIKTFISHYLSLGVELNGNKPKDKNTNIPEQCDIYYHKLKDLGFITLLEDEFDLYHISSKFKMLPL